MSENLPVKALGTTFRILEEIVEQEGATLSSLDASLDAPRSTIYDHIVSLDEMGYLVTMDEEYFISSDFLRMGDLARRYMEVYRAATEELERLATETGEHVSLTIEENGWAVIIATQEGEEAIPVQIYHGIKMHMHTAAPGKAMLAFLDDSRVEEILDKHGLVQRTENTITDESDLHTELEWIRDHNYALDDEERLTGMRSVAVPLVDRADRVRGALTIYGPTNQIGQERFRERFPDLLTRSGNIVEVLMNYD